MGASLSLSLVLRGGIWVGGEARGGIGVMQGNGERHLELTLPFLIFSSFSFINFLSCSLFL